MAMLGTAPGTADLRQGHLQKYRAPISHRETSVSCSSWCHLPCVDHKVLGNHFHTRPSAWTSKKEESRVSTSTPSEASQCRSRDTELNVTSHPYSFPLMRSGCNEVLRNASFPRTGSLACFI